MQKNKPRVIVGISSGVDSTVAAALLKEKGYDVVGVFMHFWKEPGQDTLKENRCCSLESLEEARKICRVLGIPLYTANAEKEFKQHVVDYFLREYAAGRTPNPCIACNKHIKFNVLFKKMLELKGDFIATGHYAQVKSKAQSLNAKVKKETIYTLHQSKDKEKDQTYFLYNLNQKQLARILFPVGGYKKSEVRAMAKERELPVFDKEDSQEVCFIAEKHPDDFLARNLRMKEGNIVDIEGKVLGVHRGLPLYTLGQRRGIRIGGSGPYYVVAKNKEKNALIVSQELKKSGIYSTQFSVRETHWIVEEPKFPLRAEVKIRYRHPVISAIINLRASKSCAKKGSYEVMLESPERAITPGQSAVFYGLQGEVLGGGIIT